MLTVNGQKMSKSLGNSFLPSELFAGTHTLLDRGYGPMTVRFFMLQSHYSSTLDFSNEALQAAEKGFKKLSNALGVIKSMKHPGAANSTKDEDLSDTLIKLSSSLYECMSDDFNTARTLAVLFEMTSRINDFKSGNAKLESVAEHDYETFKNAFVGFMESVLGLKEDQYIMMNCGQGVIHILIEMRKRHAPIATRSPDKIRDD